LVKKASRPVSGLAGHAIPAFQRCFAVAERRDDSPAYRCGGSSGFAPDSRTPG